MICPYCQQDDDKVVDSRASDGGRVVRRRRECLNPDCSQRFTTYERVEQFARLMVIKKDGSRVEFRRDNLLSGIQAACGKRPVSEAVKENLVTEIEEAVHRDFDREAPSREIGKMVAGRLREIDHIVYIRYVSEYSEFQTLEEFSRELDTLQTHHRNLPNQEPLFTE